jgi:threonine/homoserine/homoserine lactone efflux protein
MLHHESARSCRPSPFRIRVFDCKREGQGRPLMQLIPNPLIIPVGMAIGVLVSAPVGPVNVLCIQRAVSRGPVGGMAAGIGAVLGDGFIALFAALGVGSISLAIQDWRNSIQFLGGLVLLGFAVKLYFTAPPVTARSIADDEKATLAEFAWDIPQTFLLTITNPGAVLGLFAIFGGISTFVEVKSYIDALTMVAAVMAGGLLWWFGLSTMIGRIRHKVDVRRLHQINKIAGLLLAVFSAVLIGEIVLKLLHVI